MNIKPKQASEIIYINILQEIDNVIKPLSKVTKNEEINNAQKKALSILKGIKNELSINLEKLKKNSEWDIYTIAFYGETNAGKSTVIETLRLILGEPTKIQEQSEIPELQKILYGLQLKIDRIENDIENLNADFNLKNEPNLVKIKSIRKKINNSKNEINLLNDEIILLKKQISKKKIFQRLKFNLPERQTIKQNKIKVKEISNSIKLISKTLRVHKKEIAKNENEYFHNINRLKTELSEIIKEKDIHNSLYLSKIDGNIIGDGRSDFTTKTVSYTFKNNNKKINIIDMPGIEGNIESVQKEIEVAMEKAHAVFYITNKPTPPQKGDDKSIGTLEKIKENLELQTEIYSIYNKRINSPHALTVTLTSDEENKCLNDLEKVLRDNFGKQYIKTISLSAYPAFLVSGKYLDEKSTRQKLKFEKKFSNSNDILKLSQFDQFRDFIIEKLNEDNYNKIVIANERKAQDLLNQTLNQLSDIEEAFKESKRVVKRAIKIANSEIDNIKNLCLADLSNIKDKEMNEFSDSVLTDAFALIDADLPDKKLEKELKKVIRKKLKIFRNNLNVNINDRMSNYTLELNTILENHNTVMGKKIYSIFNSNKIPQNINFKFDFGHLEYAKEMKGFLNSTTMNFVSLNLSNVFLDKLVMSLVVLSSLFVIASEIINIFTRKLREKRIFKGIVSDVRKQLDISLDESLDEIGDKIDQISDKTKVYLNSSVDYITNIESILRQIKNRLDKYKVQI